MGADQPVLGRAGGSTDDDTGPRVAFRGSHGAIDAWTREPIDDLVAGLRCDAECSRARLGRPHQSAELRRIEGHLVAQLAVRARAGLRRDLPDRADCDDHAPLPFRTDGPRVERDSRRRPSPDITSQACRSTVSTSACCTQLRRHSARPGGARASPTSRSSRSSRDQPSASLAAGETHRTTPHRSTRRSG